MKIVITDPGCYECLSIEQPEPDMCTDCAREQACIIPMKHHMTQCSDLEQRAAPEPPKYSWSRDRKSVLLVNPIAPRDFPAPEPEGEELRDCYSCGHYSQDVSGCDPAMPKCERHKYWISRETLAALSTVRAYIEGCPRKSITDKQARAEALDALARFSPPSPKEVPMAMLREIHVACFNFGAHELITQAKRDKMLADIVAKHMPGFTVVEK